MRKLPDVVAIAADQFWKLVWENSDGRESKMSGVEALICMHPASYTRSHVIIANCDYRVAWICAYLRARTLINNDKLPPINYISCNYNELQKLIKNSIPRPTIIFQPAHFDALGLFINRILHVIPSLFPKQIFFAYIKLTYNCCYTDDAAVPFHHSLRALYARNKINTRCVRRKQSSGPVNNSTQRSRIFFFFFLAKWKRYEIRLRDNACVGSPRLIYHIC